MMDRRDYARSRAQCDHLSSLLGDPEVVSEQRARSGRAQANDDLRIASISASNQGRQARTSLAFGLS
jgi:hypothetical protein